MESVLGGDVICQASEVALPAVVGVPLHHDVELVGHHLTARRPRPRRPVGPGRPQEDDEEEDGGSEDGGGGGRGRGRPRSRSAAAHLMSASVAFLSCCCCCFYLRRGGGRASHHRKVAGGLRGDGGGIDSPTDVASLSLPVSQETDL